MLRKLLFLLGGPTPRNASKLAEEVGEVWSLKESAVGFTIEFVLAVEAA